MRKLLTRLRAFWEARNRSLLPIVFAESTPLDLRIVGRMLLHAALVGAAAGLMGAAFFGALEYAQRFVLEDLAGYLPLRAHGETFAASEGPRVFRPWLLLLLPALGGLACGLVTRMAPEARGGGGDAMIEAFHHKGGVIRRRVLWVKALASIFTLASGGSGGREGPTMQIGGALGSLVARGLRVSARERRILLVAGVAAGISAVFRTPLGAALLAVEVLYRDGFESDALVPSVFASVVSYSVVISIYGESTLFAQPNRYPFSPSHLPLYALLAVLVAALATVFVDILRAVQRTSARLPVPAWARPALGGLALGAVATPLVWYLGARIHQPGQGLGLLGGGYGAVQMAISGSAWLPDGWGGVQLLLLLCGAKLVTSSLTIGSGGSAGDFAPSLALGGLFGGAFGRAAALLLPTWRIDAGAFALVGMGAFYGGIAHVPLSALVLVCELAGSYDLLVPLMLAEGLAFVVLRHRTLYDAQAQTQRESPVHRDALLLDVLKAVRVADLVPRAKAFVSFSLRTPTTEMLRELADGAGQEVFPVVDATGRMLGIVTSEALSVLATERDDAAWALAADVMLPPVSAGLDDDLRRASEVLVSNGLRALPILDAAGKVIGLLDEAEVAKVYLGAAERAEQAARDGLAPPSSRAPG